MRKTVPVLVALFLVTLAACGGGGSNPTNPTPQPYSQHLVGTVDVFGTTEHSLSIPRAGSLVITLTWSTGVDLDLYLTNPTCTAATIASCQLFASATGTIAGRETIQRTVASGESYKLFVDNNSRSQSANYSIDLSIQ